MTTKGGWSSEKLKSALAAISEGTHIRKSAKMFDIPESTLRRRMKANNISNAVLGRKSCFSVEQEKRFAETILMSNIFYGVTAEQCRNIPYGKKLLRLNSYYWWSNSNYWCSNSNY